ncbi:virulence factor SrfB [Elioraea thermophila]|uniref:virulence factor SrfB n=1 Tax=Elioraea thermophila TaxID=2185104 RepID=UPI000DF1A141|nr:virulence factor SrfB [Elioraea thermophila]
MAETDLLSLVPQSGLQFVVRPFDEARLPRLTRAFWEEVEDQGPGAQPHVILRPLATDEADGSYHDPLTGACPPEDRVYQINTARALEPFLERWTPLPVFEVRDGRIERGPTNWVRVRLVRLPAPDSAGNTHAVVLAFDTGLVPRRSDAPYVGLAPAREEQVFALVAEPEWNAWFLRQAWVDKWLEANFREARAAARGGKLRPEDLPWRAEHWARYLTFLAVLDEARLVPRIRTLDIASPTAAARPIAVDLVLDLGNSRTCGILVEDHPDRPLDFTNGALLTLRELSAPERTWSIPFESRVEFHRASFGRDALSNTSGRMLAFHWGSPVRVGPEAVRLAALRRGDEGATGLSSPKRYLWDERPTAVPWRFNGPSADGTAINPPVSGAFMEFVSEEGDVLETIRHRKRPGMRALFSRSALTTFLLCELLMQAAVQINSPDHRAARGSLNVPRRLRRLVLTLPPAMPLIEQEILKRRAREAIDLAWSLLGWSSAGDGLPDPPPKPELVASLDEATATQLVWLYNECRWRLKSDAASLFAIAGRVRKGYGEEPALRIASIDIGGGTTDLMVATYVAEAGQAIVPKQNFREGFRIAGDDVLQALIEIAILPCIERALGEAGVSGAKAFLRELLAGSAAGQSEQERHLRRQFVSLVLEPLGLAVLRAYEGLVGRESGEILRAKLSTLLAGLPAVERAIAHVEAGAARRGGEGFSLGDVELVVTAEEVEKAAGPVLAPVLAELLEVVHAFDVDVLLLSGRLSRLRIVRDLVVARLAVPPHRVIAMDQYPVEAWYPFRNAAGRIADPKTTAAVGAMISATAEGRLEGFLLRASRLGVCSTARYVGLMDNSGQIRAQNVLFRDDAREAGGGAREASFRVTFTAPCFIGFRQLDLERWTATRLYRLEFGDASAVRRLALPLTVTLARRDIDPDQPDAEVARERFVVEEVVDAEGITLHPRQIVARLQTEAEEAGYWRDSGALRVP